MFIKNQVDASNDLITDAPLITDTACNVSEIIVS